MATLAPTFTVRADQVVAGLGLKLSLAPGGRPLIVKLNGELNPFVRVIATVYRAVPPLRLLIVTDAVLIDRE